MSGGQIVNFKEIVKIGSIIYLTTAGVSAIFLHHILRPGLVEHTDLSVLEAELVVSAEILSIIMISAVLSFTAPKFNWRELMALFLAIASIFNSISSVVLEHVGILIFLRFIAGIGEGGLIALGFCMIGLSARPGRYFSLVLAAMMVVAGCGWMLASDLSKMIGFPNFVTLLSLGYFIGFLLIMYIPRGGNELKPPSPVPNLQVAARLYPMIGLVTYGLAVGLTVSSIYEAGIRTGMNDMAVNQTIIYAQFFGAATALLMAVLRQWVGRTIPLLVGVSGAIAAIATIAIGQASLYWLGVCVFTMLWCVATPCILSTLSEFDDRGTHVLHGVTLQITGYALGVYLIPALRNLYQYGELHYVIMTLLVLSIMLILPGLWAIYRRHQMAEAVVL